MNDEARPVIVGVDGESSGWRALRWAVEESRIRGLPLRVVHAWRLPFLTPAESASEAARERIADVCRLPGQEILDQAGKLCADAGVGAELSLLEGSAADVLLSVSVEADQLVVGDHREGSSRWPRLGSVSSAVARRAVAPTTVVRGDGSSGHGRVVVGVDGSIGSERALRRAAVEADARGTELVALVAWQLREPALIDLQLPPVPSVEEVSAQAHGRLSDVVRRVLPGRTDVTVRVEHDAPADALIAAGASADLLVLGTRGLGGFSRLLLGSVSSPCVHRAPCPVQVVPDP